jgi:hypothetical protein
MSHTLPVGTIRGTAQRYVYGPNRLDWPGSALSAVHPAPADCNVDCKGMENTECVLRDLSGAITTGVDCVTFGSRTIAQCVQDFPETTSTSRNDRQLCIQCHNCSCCNQCQATGVDPDCLLAAVSGPPMSGTW